MLKPPLETLFDSFVLSYGGERVDTLIDLKNPPDNADYFFRSQNIIAELKTLEKESFGENNLQKTAELFADWGRRGLLMVYGTARVDMQRLQPVCQEEWLNLLGKPIQKNVLSKANAQIRRTKELLNLPRANGVLLVASGGNLDLTPHTIYYLISKLLAKKHPNGQPQYSQIDGVVYFSGRTLVQVGENGKPAMLWICGPRLASDEAMTSFVRELGRGWREYVARIEAKPLERVEVNPEQMKDLRFAGVPQRLPRINIPNVRKKP